MSAIVRVSSRKFYQGGSSVIIMKGGHNQMKSRCGFYSKLGYCEGVIEEFGGEVGELGGKLWLVMCLCCCFTHTDYLYVMTPYSSAQQYRAFIA